MRMPRWQGIKVLLAGAVILAVSGAVRAQDASEDIKTSVDALKQRIKDQDKRIAELEQRQAAPSQASQDDIRRIVMEMTKDAATKSAVPSWLDNLKFYGDFRLRYSGEFYNSNNGVASVKSDEYKARNRARYRLRFGFIKTWLDDQIEVGFRLASGNSNDPTSTNQTLGESSSSSVQPNEPGFAKRPIWIDMAYARYSPKELKGLTVIGGKFKNPFLNNNDIFWDGDVNPEGFWAEYTTPASLTGPLELFAGAGWFSVREQATNPDATMDGYQLGARWKIAKDLKYTFAAYQQNWRQYNTTYGVNANKGNSTPFTTIPNFNVIGLTNRLDWTMFNLPWNAFGDWAHNCGQEDSDLTTAQHHNYDGQNNAYAFGIKVGQNKKKGDWSAKAMYGWVEANALPGQYVDSDFGFANRQGFVFGPTYNLLDDLTVGCNIFITQPIFSPTTTQSSWPKEDITTTVLADLVWKF